MKRLAMAALAVLVAACAAPKPAPERALYDLGPLPEAPRAAVPLRVEVILAAWLDGADIAYRLDYDDPARLRLFAGSRWAGRPSQLFAGRLAARAAAGPARCTLRVELDDFAQRFASATASSVRLSGRWQVVAGGAPLAGGSVRIEEAAGGDAPAGVRAAARAIDRLGDEVLAAAGAQPACVP